MITKAICAEKRARDASQTSKSLAQGAGRDVAWIQVSNCEPRTMREQPSTRSAVQHSDVGVAVSSFEYVQSSAPQDGKGENAMVAMDSSDADDGATAREGLERAHRVPCTSLDHLH